MAPDTVVLQHPAIGSIRGNRQSSQAEQYLGIQYAKLTDRFARGNLVESYPTSIDATSHGPLPVANPSNCDMEQLLLQHELPHPAYEFSDVDCLTLNVSVPNAGLRAKTGKPLPVLVFVHGGGYVTGSGNWPQWDLAALVELSISQGSPIVAVGINYRLGPFGFMTSAAMREAGYLPNNGLHDQKLALRWVQKHIAGFGGDPKTVTFFGCSIGAASGFVHLQSEEALFSRLAAWGGSGLMRPLPLEVAEVGYGMVVKALGIESLSPADQVRELARIPQDEFESKTRDVHAPYMAWVDGDIVRGVPTFAALSSPKELEQLLPGVRWCPTVWMGDCALDGAIFLITALMGRTDDLTQALTRCISTTLAKFPDIIPELVSLFNLDSASNTEAKNLAVANFSTDIAFAQAAKASAQAWYEATGTALLSHFTCPNPWDGGWKGHATHGLDAAFMLQNYRAFMSAGQRACAERMGRDIVSFVAGGKPYPWVGEDGGREVVYYAGAEGEVDASEVVGSEEAARSARRQELEKIVAGRPQVLDGLMDALGMFLSGA